MKDWSRIFHLMYALLTYARTYAYEPPIEAWRWNRFHSCKLPELQKLTSRMLLLVFCMNHSYYYSRFGIAITIYFYIKYSTNFTVTQWATREHLHQLHRSHYLLDKILFIRTRNLCLYLSHEGLVTQQIKKTWRAKTSRTEYVVKANRIFEKATTCSIKEKALILQ